MRRVYILIIVRRAAFGNFALGAVEPQGLDETELGNLNPNWRF